MIYIFVSQGMTHNVRFTFSLVTLNEICGRINTRINGIFEVSKNSLHISTVLNTRVFGILRHCVDKVGYVGTSIEEKLDIYV